MFDLLAAEQKPRAHVAEGLGEGMTLIVGSDQIEAGVALGGADVRDLADNNFGDLGAEFAQGSEAVVEEADDVEQAEAEEEAGGGAQAEEDDGAADGFGLRGGVHDADVLLVERAVHIHLLDDAEELLIQGLTARDILSDAVVISHFAARIERLGFPFASGGLDVGDLEPEGLAPVAHLGQALAPEDLEDFSLNKVLRVQKMF